MSDLVFFQSLPLGLQSGASFTEIAAGISSVGWVILAMSLFLVATAPGRFRLLAGLTALAVIFLPSEQAFVVVLTLLMFGLGFAGIQTIPEGRVALVERLGRFHRVLDPGINFIVPGVDKLKDVEAENKLCTMVKGKPVPLVKKGSKAFISTKEHLLDVARKQVICADNTVVHVDSIAYFQILDPESAVYNVDNLGEAMETLLETSLRQEVGRLTSDDVIVSRGIIGTNVQVTMETATEAWGVRVIRVEIEDIHFDPEVQRLLDAKRQAELSGRGEIAGAERLRDTAVATAEGEKKAAILIAEGNFEARRLTAEGDYLLELKRRQGEAEGLQLIADALKTNPEAAVALEALKAQALVAKYIGMGSTTMILPAEATGLFGALGALKQFKGFVDGMPSTKKTEDDDPIEST